VPHPDDPDGLTGDAIEEAVRGHEDLAIGKIGEPGKDTAGPRKPLQST
jgi:hypothetical protein